MTLGNVSRGRRINSARLAQEKTEKLLAALRAELAEQHRLEVVGLEMVSRAPYEVTERSRFEEEE